MYLTDIFKFIFMLFSTYGMEKKRNKFDASCTPGISTTIF